MIAQSLFKLGYEDFAIKQKACAFVILAVLGPHSRPTKASIDDPRRLVVGIPRSAKEFGLLNKSSVDRINMIFRVGRRRISKESIRFKTSLVVLTRIIDELERTQAELIGTRNKRRNAHRSVMTHQLVGR